MVVPGAWQWVSGKLSILHLSETTVKMEPNSGGKGWWGNDLEESLVGNLGAEQGVSAGTVLMETSWMLAGKSLMGLW